MSLQTKGYREPDPLSIQNLRYQLYIKMLRKALTDATASNQLDAVTQKECLVALSATSDYLTA